MRIFVALDLPTDVKEEIVKIQEKLKNQKNVKLVEKENLHITLKFYGEIKYHELNIIYNIVEKSLYNQSSFKISLENIGFFPNKFNPKVIWIGINEGSNNLKEIFEKIENLSRKSKLRKEDKPYTPHLTLARVKFPSSSLFKVIEEIEKEYNNKIISQFEAKEITVYESVLTPSGPIYKKLKTYNL